MKLCAHCKAVKPNTDFYSEPRMKSGLASWCKQCGAAGARERYKLKPENAQVKLAGAKRWREANKSWVKSYQQGWHTRNREYQLREFFKARLKRKYGLSVVEYEAMVEEQSGRCAICHKPERLVVDHDHATGKVRGLLCNFHNKGLGMFRDSPEHLRSAAEYLERSKAE